MYGNVDFRKRFHAITKDNEYNRKGFIAKGFNVERFGRNVNLQKPISLAGLFSYKI